MQDFVGSAPLNLVYVSDADHFGDIGDSERHRIASADTGFIGQNVYLYCASQGLATVVRGSLDTVALGQILGLKPSQFVTFSQTVGYPRA